MKNITNWLFHLFYVKRLKEVQSLSFKMKLETDTLKSNAIVEIDNEVEQHWLSINGLLYKLGIKSIQNLRARLHRDDFGKQALSHNPVFSANQIAAIKIAYWVCLTLIVFLSGAESFLYKLTASLFVAGAGEVVHYIISILFAVGLMWGLGFGFDQHFKYREVMERHEKEELTDIQLHKYRDMRYIGYFLFAICFGAIVFSGFARIFYLEYIPARGMSPERVASVTKASKMASIFSLLFTLLISFVTVTLKMKLAKASIQYQVYKEWHAAHVSRNDYTQRLYEDAKKLTLEVGKIIQKYWQLVADLKRVFKMKNEYDEMYATLNQEYIQLKAKPGFVVTTDIYSKFSPIQCAHEELFEFGIRNSKEIKDKLEFAEEILKVPKEHLEEHLMANLDHKKEPKDPQTIKIPATNGKAKEHEFSLH
jgi:hypothetical protein